MPEVVDCTDCGNTIEEPTDDHKIDGDYYCHKCKKKALVASNLRSDQDNLDDERTELISQEEIEQMESNGWVFIVERESNYRSVDTGRAREYHETYSSAVHSLNEARKGIIEQRNTLNRHGSDGFTLTVFGTSSTVRLSSYPPANNMSQNQEESDA